MDYIEKVVYINLEHRTDRKEQVEQELLKVFPSEKIVRFNAIKHEKGGIGCSTSHIGALELAMKNNWKNVLIVEDDMEWKDFDKGVQIFNQLIKIQHDVILLSGHEVRCNRNTYKLEYCCARTAYLVENHYYPILLDNFKTGLSMLEKQFIPKYRGDRFWNRIQERDKWYIIMPQVCIQKPSFSDIEQKNVNYTNNLAYSPKKGILNQILGRK